MTALEKCCIDISNLCVEFMVADNYDKEEFIEKYNQIVLQALSDEKNQIIKAYEDGQKETANGFFNKLGIKYYNQTYKQ